jgi:hypothetical protein
MEEETNALTRTGTGFTLRVVLDQIICPPSGQDASAFFWISQPAALSHFDCDKDSAEKALPATLSHYQITRQPLKALPLIESNLVIHRKV